MEEGLSERVMDRKVKEKNWRFVARGLLVLLLCLLVLLGISQIRSLWSRDFNYLVVLVGDDLSLVVINPVAKQVVTMRIPRNMMMPVVGMEGMLKAGSIWKFGEGEGRAIMTTKTTVESFFGVKVDGLLHVVDKDKVEPRLFLRPVVTDLPLVDRLRLAWFLTSLREDQYREIELSAKLGETKTLPDGSETIVVNPERLEKIRQEFINEKILASRLRIIVNDRSGMAQTASLAERMILAVGGLTARIEKADPGEGWCLVKVGEKDTEEIMVRWFEEKLDCKKEVSEGEMFQATVVLGKKWGEYYR